MPAPLAGLSSMATRLLLAELAGVSRRGCGVDVCFESVGGVDAVRRVQAGEAFDLVVLASDAIDRLIAGGHAVAASKADLVHSDVAIAVRAGAAGPEVGSEAALRRAVLAARTIGYSTGPSGTALQSLFERWGVAPALQGRLVQAPPGVPVGQLVARGEVELGFQQRSELLHQDGITVIGAMPPGAEIRTTFSAACCTTSGQPAAVGALLRWLRSPATADAKRRHGLEPA